jgi:bifunctional non-homologous end joining protein LigD
MWAPDGIDATARTLIDKSTACDISPWVTLPRVQPIIPISRKDPFDDPEWLFDLKYDGFRALLYIEQGIRCRFVSRNGNILSRFDALCQAVSAALDIDSVILDGEVIAADESGRPLFYDLVRASRKPAFVAFDLLWLNGADLRSLPLSERRRRLHELLPKGSPVISEALSVRGRGHDLFKLMRTHDIEGIVAKRLADPYDSRVRWFKIKYPDYSQKEGRRDLFNRPRRMK